MLLRHSASYLLARGVPGLLNFAALAIYTRLLTADEFGQYTLILAGIGLVDLIAFHWLRLTLARFIPAHEGDSAHIQEPVLAIFIAVAGTVCTAGFVAALATNSTIATNLITTAVLLTVAQAWLELNLLLASAQLSTSRFGRLLGSKTALSVLVGSSLAWVGLGAQAPILGLLTGSVISWVLFGVTAWKGIHPRWPSLDTFLKFASYGLPLAITSSLGWVIASSDRFIIAYYLGTASTAIYAVGCQISELSLGLMLASIHLAAYFVAIHRLEKDGVDAAKAQLKLNGELIVALALAGAAGLIALAPVIVDLFLGEDFREGAVGVIPWIAASAAISGIKAYHFDVAFHLSRQSLWLVVTGVIAAATNLTLNLGLIPLFGLRGGAWSALTSVLLAAVASAYFGCRTFPMPPFLPILARGLAVSVGAYFGAFFATHASLGNWATLILGTACGAATATVIAFALNLSEIRSQTIHRGRLKPK